MNTIVKKNWIYLLGLLLSVPAFSQRNNLVMYRDTITRRDTVLTQVNFLSDDSHDMQYKIKVRLKDGTERVFMSHEIIGYRKNKKTYHSKLLKIDGRIHQVLLPRMYDEDSVAIYQFIQDNGKRKLYAGFGKDSLIIPITDEKNPDYINPLYLYLKQFPIVQNEIVGKFFDRLKPTVGSFARRHLVAKTNNPNYMTRFRWGIMMGASIGKARVKDFAFANKLMGFGGVFADIPIFGTLSVHPEVIFYPYAYSSRQLSEASETNAVYNRKDLTGTLLFRHTLRFVKGKWLPYAMLGPEINWILDKSVESARRWIDNEGFTELEQLSHPQTKNTTVGLTGGVGVEYILTHRNSLFFDVRYRHELEKEGVKGIYFTLSFNL